ncbi:uncharacterized protein BDR25DRAFT_91907 [Lindgomyces ingoldianus]|uniref:Uncharacterized protein n=1 Tax=Lindgomyces ingoldianus TaxID=673940 RepID=A0ACB6QFR3_9PLEO|nr:uncharacterized protein BDR25DRAFT_91907 [Lindgomyces ingoldianus]KAF2464990.1 hypothetical protein BDR25DRAFT_91907 [Lindgomyces ingoldianus]
MKRDRKLLEVRPMLQFLILSGLIGYFCTGSGFRLMSKSVSSPSVNFASASVRFRLRARPRSNEKVKASIVCLVQ